MYVITANRERQSVSWRGGVGLRWVGVCTRGLTCISATLSLKISQRPKISFPMNIKPTPPYISIYINLILISSFIALPLIISHSLSLSLYSVLQHLLGGREENNNGTFHYSESGQQNLCLNATNIISYCLKKKINK